MRGMKKWLPFKSLKGQYEVIDAMKKERAWIERPELSEDRMAEINETLVSLSKGQSIAVTFYCDHELMTKRVVFDRLSYEQRKVYFVGFALPVYDIMAVRTA